VTFEKRNTGKVLQGYFFKYLQPFYQGDRWKVIPKGAFDESLRTDHVRALLEHNPALEIGHSRQNLILHSNDTGIAFQIHLRDDEISNQVRAMVEAKLFLDCSIGFRYAASDTEERTFSKTQVIWIKKATLLEGSLLKAGACATTSVTLKSAKDCDYLYIEATKPSFACDNAYTDVVRSLRDLRNLDNQ
jgi:HK97 family phage prohead protease